MVKKECQKGHIALVMVVILMTIGLLLIKSLHSYQEQAQHEWYKEAKYYHAFNQAESALAWGLTLQWEASTSKNWVCQQNETQNWTSCLKPYKGSVYVLLGQSPYKQGASIKVYQWVEWDAKKQRILPRKNGWLDYCPVQQKGFCV